MAEESYKKIFSTALDLYFKNFGKAFLIVLLFGFIAFLFNLIPVIVFNKYSISSDVYSYSQGFLEFLLTLLFSAISWILTIFALVTLIKIYSDKKMQSAGIFEVIGRSSAFYIRSIGVLLLMAIILGIVFLFSAFLLGIIAVMIGIKSVVTAMLVFLPAILITIALYIYLTFPLFALVNENIGVLDSLRKSFEVVRGRWWKVFGYQLLTGILVFGVILLLFIVFMMGILFVFPYLSNLSSRVLILRDPTFIFSFSIGVFSLIAESLIIPFTTGFLQSFYLNLRDNPRK